MSEQSPEGLGSLQLGHVPDWRCQQMSRWRRDGSAPPKPMVRHWVEFRNFWVQLLSNHTFCSFFIPNKLENKPIVSFVSQIYFFPSVLLTLSMTPPPLSHLRLKTLEPFGTPPFISTCAQWVAKTFQQPFAQAPCVYWSSPMYQDLALRM